MNAWPATAEELVRAQEEVARAAPPRWRPAGEGVAAAACFVCFERGPSGQGRRGETAWAGAAAIPGGRPPPRVPGPRVGGGGLRPGAASVWAGRRGARRVPPVAA